MSRRPLIVLVALLAVLALGFTALWKLTQSPPASAVGKEPEIAASAQSPAPEAAAPLEAAHEESAPVRHEVAKVAPEKPTAAARALLTPLEAELKQGHWVEGKVKFPDGTPPDEKLRVEARGKKFSNDTLHSVEVGRDGAFRVAFSKATRTGWLRVVARYGYLPEDLKVKFPSKPGAVQTFDLEPLLGSLVRGRVTLPPAAQGLAGTLVGTPVQLWPHDSGRAGDNRVSNLWGEIGPELAFEIGGLPPKSTFTFHTSPENFVQAEKQAGTHEAGRATDIEFVLEQGVRIAGKVVDEDGTAVAEASFQFQAQNPSSSGWTNFREKKSANDGSFDLRGMPAVQGKLFVRKEGFVNGELAFEKSADGSVQEGLRIVLRRGLEIAGLVQGPDGKPCAGATVSLHFSPDSTGNAMPWLVDRDQSVRSDAQGRFRFTGMQKGTGTLRAEAKAQDSAPVEASAASGEVAAAEPEGAEAAAREAAPAAAASESKQAKPKSSSREDKRRKWTAIQEDVTAGTQNVLLALGAGYSVSGRVLDAGGAPVQEFLVRAEPIEKSDEFRVFARNTQMRRFKDEAGRFTFEGLHEGGWKLSAESTDSPACAPRTVQLPGDGAPVELVLARAAELRGVVVDPKGVPVLGAKVRVEVENDKRSLSVFNAGKDFEDTSDKQGKFELTGVPAGPAKLLATSDEWAAATPLAVELAPGQKLAELRLVLRQPGRIVGKVVDEAGHADPERPVSLSGRDGTSEWRQATSDAQGRFEFEKLAPGKYALSTQAKSSELEAAGDDDDKRSRVWQEQQRSATVVVEEGATAEVTLGGPPKDGLQLSGTVTSGGKPLADAALTFWKMPQTEGGEPRQRHATTAANGGYALVLEGPGNYSVSVQPARSGTHSSFQLELATSASQTKDFEVAGGVIAGRVVDRAGKPQADLWLELQGDSRVRGQRSNVSGNKRTDEEGRFRFEHVAGGTYEIACVGRNYGWNQSQIGRSTLSGLKLEEGKSLEGLELVLQPACTVEGSVLGPGGTPVAGATVIVLGEDGQLLNGWGRETSDATGHFSFDRLPPGRASFCALKGAQSSGSSAWVEVQESAPAKVELALADGTFVFVQVLDAEDKPLQADVQVFDAHGLDQSALGNWEAQPPAVLPGRRFGPLARGTYSVVVMLKDKPDVRQELHVSGEATQALNVRVH